MPPYVTRLPTWRWPDFMNRRCEGFPRLRAASWRSLLGPGRRQDSIPLIAFQLRWGTMVIIVSQSYLLVIGEAAALAWVLAEQRMAFPALRRSQAAALEVGDELLVYTTRACFHNPTRDAGRVMALSTVKTSVCDLDEPVVFRERRYTSGCSLDIQGVARLHQGIELRQIVPELHAFPDVRSWSVQLRRPLVPLDEHDRAILTRQLTPLLEPLERNLQAYVQVGRLRG
jgi:hypothetical protein